MRYISPNARLAIYNYNGRLVHQFEQHELVVGTPFNDGVEIDATTKTPFEETLQRVFDTGFTSADELLEKVGLGSLALTTEYRNFFRSPLNTVPYTTTLEGYYEVNQGTLLISSETYGPGEKVYLPNNFAITSVMQLTTGTAYVSLYFPKELWPDECLWDASAEFKKNVLLEGDESNDYWLYSHGYKPKNSLDPDSSDYVGWIRKK